MQQQNVKLPVSVRPASPTPTLLLRGIQDYFKAKSDVPSSQTSLAPQIQQSSDDDPKRLLSEIKSLVDSPGDLAEGLRQLILKTSIHDRMHRYKIVYQVGSGTVSTAVLTTGLNQVAFNDNTQSRLSNEVYTKKMLVKLALNYTANGHSGASYVAPVVGLVFWLHKLPVVPGTPSSLFDVDANPPITSGTVYSQLGYAGNGARLIAPRSSVTNVEYFVYEHHILYEPKPFDFNLNGNAPGSVTQMPFQRVFTFDLTKHVHNLQSLYQNDTSNNPITNQVWMSIYSNVNPSGGSFTYEYTVEHQFEDAVSSV